MIIYSIQRQLEFEAEFNKLKEKYFVDDIFIIDHIEEHGTFSTSSDERNDDDIVDDCYADACDIVADYKMYA